MAFTSFDLPGATLVAKEVEDGAQGRIRLVGPYLARKRLFGRSVDIDAEVAQAVSHLGLVAIDAHHCELVLHLALYRSTLGPELVDVAPQGEQLVARGHAIERC